ncbi:DUF6908 domain-containing protein [Granulicella rosea]|uniref:DUF6908 domain-containing protein n=1 Tax=Granulicella rosea TaxID=474952 RepID=UPI003CCBD4E9
MNTAPELCRETPLHIIRRFTQYWRNDYVAIEQWSRFIREGNYCYHSQLHTEHERFAKLWDKNLRLQGFAEAFERQRHQHA